MKKLISALAISTIVSTAQALPNMRPIAHNPASNTSYNLGYNNGKSHAYERSARTAVIVGVAVIAGVIIYQLGKDSNWGVNQNGVTYKF